MAGICGYIATDKGVVDLPAFLAAGCPIAPPPNVPPSCYVQEGMGAAAYGTDCLARSGDGRYVCAFDGRIFDADRRMAALRQKGVAVAAGDTAALFLHLYLTGGVEAFRDVEGGYAAAILDTRDKAVVLFRDPFGVKSVYYAQTPRGVLFSSSLTALAKCDWFPRTIGMSGFLEYVACGYVSAPWTIYEHAFGLKPGDSAAVTTKKVSIAPFHALEPAGWRFADTGNQTDDQLADTLDRLLTEATQRRLPPGDSVAAYLSGGLDTSLLCAKLKEVGDRRVVAYTLGFPGGAHDETPYAAAVAKHLGIEHRPFAIGKEEALDTLRRLPQIYGQPFADISAIPTHVIARKVGREFDAVFDGQGPDFLFGNFDLRVLYRFHNGCPHVCRRALAALVTAATRRFWKRWTSPNLDVPELLRQPEFFWIFTRMFKSTDLEAVVGEPVYPESFWSYRFLRDRPDIPLGERLRLAQYLCYGINDVLYKAHGAHAAAHVEILCPYFDLAVLDFIQYLPTRYKFRRFYGKYLQKHLIRRKIPRHILERPKRGFIMDFVEFGVSTTRELTDKYLTRERLNETGLINADFAVRCVRDYYAGDTNMGPKLWTLLMFEMWRDAFHAGAP